MPLKAPNLDDRSFTDLTVEAQELIRRLAPEWTDLSPGDPGVTLIEVFAYLTDIMLYRLNRIPDKAYIEFLKLIGVELQAPTAASVMLEFKKSRKQNKAIEIPRGTRVSTSRSSGDAVAPVFVTSESANIAADQDTVSVLAHQCEEIEAELVGTGSGLPGLQLNLARPPVIAPTGDELDLVIGVEVQEDEIDAATLAIRHNDKTYRIWREVENFSNLEGNGFVYVADRLAGIINFAPAVQVMDANQQLTAQAEALAEIPQAGREVRVWYRRGGGAGGNVIAGILNVMKDKISGIEVNNPKPATGGRDAEKLDNAMLRGPQELHSLHRAVTARDFELLAKRSSGAVDRAHAFTKAKLWRHAPPGTVDVLLVPHIPEAQRGQGLVAYDVLKSHQTDAALKQIHQALDQRKPLGTTCLVNWARIKPVRIKAQVIVHREEDPQAVKQRVLQRLWKTINPLVTSADNQGWPFGKALSAWDIYKIVGEEPGVKSLSQVRLLVEHAPDSHVSALCADSFQPHTWYAAAGDCVYRSTNDADGWEMSGQFDDENIVLVKAFPLEASTRPRPGLLALASHLSGNKESALHISHDCGETWEIGLRTNFSVRDMAWIDKNGVPVLLLATEKGLYELAIHARAEPNQILVNPDKPSQGYDKVAVSADVLGGTSVAVAAADEQGVYLSDDGTKKGSFRSIGLKSEFIQVLAFQHFGPHKYLWAGIGVIGDDPGKGCFRWHMTGIEDNPEGWVAFDKAWQAGGCRDLTFNGTMIYAASLKGGVVRLDVARDAPQWQAAEINCNLPLQGSKRLFEPVNAIVTDPNQNYLLAGGIEGVYRSSDQGQNYEEVSCKEFREQLSLPVTWLFTSGEHEIDVRSEDEIE